MDYKALLKHLNEEKHKIFNHLKNLQKRFKENSSVPKADVPLRIEQLESYYKFYCDTSRKFDEILSVSKIEYFGDNLDAKCKLLYLEMKNDLWTVKSIDESTKIESGDSSTMDSSFDHFLEEIHEKFPKKSPEPIVNEEIKEETTKKPSKDLPQIGVRKFSGQQTDWPVFRNEYRALVHANLNMTNSQKFLILKSLVPEEVFEPIKNIFIYRDDIGYEDAWELLEEKFSKRNNVEELLQTLIQQPSLNGSSESIVELLETIKKCLNGLMYWDVDTKNWDLLLIHLLIGKLDEETKNEWNNEINSSTTSKSIFDFVNFLSSKLRTGKEFSNDMSSIDKDKHKLRCICCQRNHPLWKCKKFELLSINARISLVSDNTICVRCLAQDHIISKCWKPFSCRICHKRDHHFLLHKNDKRSKSCENLLN